MDEIRANINNYVNQKGTSIVELAKAVGISRSSLYDKMAGRSPWMLADVISLADHMGCTVQDLLTKPATGAA